MKFLEVWICPSSFCQLVLGKLGGAAKHFFVCLFHKKYIKKMKLYIKKWICTVLVHNQHHNTRLHQSASAPKVPQLQCWPRSRFPQCHLRAARKEYHYAVDMTNIELILENAAQRSARIHPIRLYTWKCFKDGRCMVACFKSCCFNSQANSKVSPEGNDDLWKNKQM